MSMSDEELAALAERAARIASGLPSVVRASLAAEVFRALRHEAVSGVVTPGVRPLPMMGAARAVPDSLGEYLAEFRDLPHPTRLVAIAGFRLEREGIESVTSDDFLAAYRETRASRPQNLSANLARCIKRGWLAPDGTKDGQKAWRVTQRGLAMLRETRSATEV